MCRERYFLSDEDGKHLLFIDIKKIHCRDGTIILKWEGSWREHFIHPNTTPEITDLLSEAVWCTNSREQREPIINETLKLIARLQGVEWQYLSDFLLDSTNQWHLSEAQLAFYKQSEKRIDINPVPFMHLNEPYTGRSNALTYEIIGYEIRQKFLLYLKDHILNEITQDTFESFLVTDPLRESYVEHYHTGSRYYALGWDFPEIGHLQTLMVTENFTIPFFFFTKAPVKKLYSLS